MSELKNNQNQISLTRLEDLVRLNTGYKFSVKDKEYIYEVHKAAKQHVGGQS